MKTQVITAALLVAVSTAMAQGTKQSTVRIVKIENTNGVSKVWDTTYNAAPGEMNGVLDKIDLETTGGKDLRSIVTVLDGGQDGENDFAFTFSDSAVGAHRYRIITSTGELTPELKAMIEDIRTARKEQMEKEPAGTIPKRGISVEEPSPGKPPARRLVIVRAIRISDAEPAEIARLEPVSNDLKVDRLACYPNPATDKINLDFMLHKEDEAVVSIYSPEGQVVYQERLRGPEGMFSKEIDLSGFSRGVYFLRIIQGDEAHTKKLVIE